MDMLATIEYEGGNACVEEDSPRYVSKIRHT